jgi:D-alanyl-D-alanine dipeptidase
MRVTYFLLGLLLGVVETPSIGAQVADMPSDAFAHSTQMILVTTSNWDAIGGTLQRYERGTAHEMWRQIGDPIPIVVGMNGMAWGIGLIATDNPAVRLTSDPQKKEGDGRAPAGVFALGTAFGSASKPLAGLKLPYLNLTPSIECVDDARSKYYNRVVDRSTVAPDWSSSEHMLSVGEAYRWGIVVDQNSSVMQVNNNPPIPEGGSCVFLHIWRSRSRGTAGCTAMPQSDLEILLTWLDPKREPLLVQLPAPAYARLKNRWGLPPLARDAAR